MSLPSNLSFRLATLDDVPGMVDIVCQARDDGTVYTYPSYPVAREQTRRRRVGFFRWTVFDPTMQWRLAVVPREDGRGERVIAISGWSRTVPKPDGSGETVSKTFKKHSWMDSLHLGLEGINNKYQNLINKLYPDPDFDQHRHKQIRKGRSIAPDFNPAIPSWHLGGLAIHPDYQRKGLGKQLMKYGMDLAAQDGVPLFTGAEATAIPFYLGLGFKIVPTTSYWLDGEGNFIDEKDIETKQGWKKENGGVSGSSLMWFPKGVSADIYGQTFTGE